MKFVHFIPLFGIAFLFTSCSTLRTAEYRSQGNSVPRTRVISSSSGIQLQWPLDGNIKINQKFKPSSMRRFRHQGIDLGGKLNTPIYSAHDGFVIYAGTGFQGYGKMVILESPNGFATFYAHLNKINVREGQWINVGEPIASMGRTGHATGVHLHFEVRVNSTPLNPLSYLPTYGKSLSAQR